MGKEKESKFNPNNNKDLFRLARQFGVSEADFTEEDTGSQGHFDRKGFAQAVEDAWANDYDVRRTLEAASLAGEDVPEGINSLEDAYKTLEFMETTHKDHLNRGGKFSSNGDHYGVSNYWVKQHQRKNNADLENKWTSDIEEQLASGTDGVSDDQDQQNKPIEYSDVLKGAMSRQAERQAQQNSSDNNITDSETIFGNTDKMNENEAAAFEQGDGMLQRESAAQSLLDKYKLDLSSGDSGAVGGFGNQIFS